MCLKEDTEWSRKNGEVGMPQRRYLYNRGNTVPKEQEEYQPIARPRSREERKRLERKRRMVHRNRQKILEFTKKDLFFLLLGIAIVGGFSIRFVRAKSMNIVNMNRSVQIESRLNELKASNDALEKQIIGTEDLRQVRKDALKMGLTYPSNSQIIYYNFRTSDYMKQY